MFLGWVSLILWLTGGLGGKEAPLIFFGTFFAWVYLRFFMRDGETGQVGDLRNEFSLATFFPDILGLRPLVEFAGTIVFQTLYRFGFFTEAVKSNASLPTTSETIPIHPNISNANATLAAGGGGDLYRNVDPTAERRRLLAIKAIDDKLAELARQPATSMSYPDLNPLASPNDTLLNGNGVSGSGALDTPISPSSLDSSVTLPSEEELAEMEKALANNTTTNVQ